MPEFKILTKTIREGAEFYDDKLTDARIRAIILELARYSIMHFNIPITITSVYRTGQEQIQTYPIYFRDNGIPYPSAHCEKPSRAIDIRSSVYTKEQILELNNWFSHWFDLGAYYSFIHHDVAGFHIHVQVGKLLT